MSNIALPYTQIIDPASFKSILNAKIYIGEYGVLPNPANSATWKQAYFVQDDGTRVAASQPIRTNAAGFAVDGSGNIRTVQVDGQYSILVQDSLSVQKYSNTRVADFSDGIATYAKLRTFTGVTDYVYVGGRTNYFDGANGFFAVDTTDTTSEDNDGTILVDSSGRRWKREFSGPIIPLWFGAAAADATTAIQAAVTAAATYTQIQNNGSVYRAAIKAVDFQDRVYTISDSINLTGYDEIIADKARIEMTDATKDHFKVGDINISTGVYVSGAAYLVSIKGVTFFGGRRHIVLANNNIDSNQLDIEHCEFFNSASYSLDVLAISGQLRVKECKFHNNWKIGRLANDMKTFESCWFDGSKAMTANEGQIINAGGTLYVKRCIGLPGSQLAARWIDDYTNHVQIENFRPGDEGGNGGWPLIYAFGAADTSTRYSPAIVIRDSYTGGGLLTARADASMVYLKKPASGTNRVPPIIIIDDVTKQSSLAAIGTDMTDAEINTAVNLHAGLTYYSVTGLQTETYGRGASMPLPIKQRSLKRSEIDLKGAATNDTLLFRHFVTKQMIVSQGASYKITYSGEVANNANTKALRVKFDGTTVVNSTYTPPVSTARKFFGELSVLAFNETSVLISHKVIDGAGVQVSAIEFIGGKDFVNTEYALDLYTDGAALGDITIVMLNVDIKP